MYAFCTDPFESESIVKSGCTQTLFYLAILVAALNCWTCTGSGSGAGDAGSDVDADTDSDADADSDADTLVAVILSPSDGFELEEGSTADFEGDAEGGVPPYEFEWTFDGLATDSTAQNPGQLQVGLEGSYVCSLEVVDSAGEHATASVTVEVSGLQGDMNFYFGNLHSHSDLSDGEGSPSEVLTWARDDAGLDFYAMTDHSEQLFGSEFADMGTETDLFNEAGVFVALRGFEWSHPINGHMCIYDTDTYTAAYTSIWINYIYDWIEDNDGIAQFNHPGREIGVFNNLALEPQVVDNMFGIETGNKSDGVNDGEFLPYYIQALDNGWRVAPTNNQDNHSMSVNSHRTVYIGEQLNRVAMKEAIVARRLYSSDDPDTRIVFKQGDAWMGEEVSPSGDSIVLSVKVVADEPVSQLRIVTNGGSEAAAYTPPDDTTSLVWFPQVSVGASTYFYLELTEIDELDDDGPVQMAVTAPIWII